MIEDGMIVKHKVLGYSGAIEGTTKINGPERYRVRLRNGSVQVALEHELIVIGDGELMPIPPSRSLVYNCIRKHNLYYLIHATHKDNLEQILDVGLCSDKLLREQNLGSHSLANATVQSIRDDKEVYLFGSIKKGIHDCVPLYMSWRTPTLYSFIKEATPAKVIHILVDTCKVLTRTGCTYCFTDGNAASQYTKQYVLLTKLDNLDWFSIKNDNWMGEPEKIRRKNAEFLIYPKVEVADFYRIIVYDKSCASEINELLKKKRIDVKVDINPKYYEWPHMY